MLQGSANLSIGKGKSTFFFIVEILVATNKSIICVIFCDLITLEGIYRIIAFSFSYSRGPSSHRTLDPAAHLRLTDFCDYKNLDRFKHM